MIGKQDVSDLDQVGFESSFLCCKQSTCKQQWRKGKLLYMATGYVLL